MDGGLGPKRRRQCPPRPRFYESVLKSRESASRHLRKPIRSRNPSVTYPSVPSRKQLKELPEPPELRDKKMHRLRHLSLIKTGRTSWRRFGRKMFLRAERKWKIGKKLCTKNS